MPRLKKKTSKRLKQPLSAAIGYEAQRERIIGTIASASLSYHFGTAHRIIKMMVQMPAPKGAICRPACGTSGLLGETTFGFCRANVDHVAV